MIDQSAARTLHPLEVKLILAFDEDEIIDSQRVKQVLGFREGQEQQAFSWLLAKGVLEEAERKTEIFYELTPLGQEWHKKGIPAKRIFSLLKDRGPMSLPEIAQSLGLDQKTVGSAFGSLSKEGVCTIDEARRAKLSKNEFPLSLLEIEMLLALASSQGGSVSENALSNSQKTLMAQIAKKRGAQDSPFRIADRIRVFYRVTPIAKEYRNAISTLGMTGEELGAITPEMLEKGTWKQGHFRPYNVQIPPARVIPGRRNAYVEFLESVKDKLVSLGFVEFDGNLVETEFWNSDALFMPQFHSARDIHDVYYIEEPTHARFIEEPYLSHVAAAHENGGNTGSRGWQYQFDRDFTRRLILRSQGTVLSARQLPKAEVPGKYFGIVRCFRYDRVDATHLSDFYQTEGIVLGKNVNLRTLLGFLEMFAVEVAGAKEVKYVPGYFPFTEPSIEVHIKHPVLGWFELGGSGIFRPEVTSSLGVEVPVLAWGIGIDRMALMALGLNDLRDLFCTDLESVRMRRSQYRIQ
ncbi:MAG TPA: phenylalanine--tRNA ligase subunit alpha [Rectinema sp.]|nr:phenylalanine--tRNA ligase subunit alpha [Spirochaetaceae bacterium]HNY98455.1 phenylalanine--tRNA ligase subunit alpha [Rectinema sp.]HOM91989.1 phenylalanine--tRNA ligase subunit alpha [Rectinema sp.]HOW11839.1 phenylalanine--tRNA ligase subunit alpha [Rectinema sp.]HQB06256.1 phenylalanine--tRNA ligase subunit alpha [Rectinema sp.]